MLIKRKKRYITTTDSSSGENRFENLIKKEKIEGADKVYLSDITYIRINRRFKYLALVTDASTRKIMGYSSGDSITTELCLRAIEMAVNTSVRPTAGIIHHSDQGCQYASHLYKEKLETYGMKQSMSRRGNPYDNAIAERVIGTLKREYLLGMTFTNENYLARLIDEAVKSYNSRRPHMSLGYLTPDEVYYNGIQSNSVPATPSRSYLN